MAVIDLSQLPMPQIVDVSDFETLFVERKAEFVALHPKDEQEAMMYTLELESELVTKLLQENAYRELLLRQHINEVVQAVMAAYVMGSDLDQLAANYNAKRLMVTPADDDAVPPVVVVMESGEMLRLRVPVAFEGPSVVGSTATYGLHARSANGRVADASATSPAPAKVVLMVLSREGDGIAEKDLLDVVGKTLNSGNVRPVADHLAVCSAEIIPYRVEATIFFYPGLEVGPVTAMVKASLQRYIASQTWLGRDAHRSAIFAVLYVEGVQRVESASSLADVVLNKIQAASRMQWNMINGGTDEQSAVTGFSATGAPTGANLQRDLQPAGAAAWLVESSNLSGQFPALPRPGVFCGSLGRGLDRKRQASGDEGCFLHSSTQRNHQCRAAGGGVVWLSDSHYRVVADQRGTGHVSPGYRRVRPGHHRRYLSGT